MARSFSGTTDKIVTTSPGITGTNARSYAIWFKTTSITGSSSNWAYCQGALSTGGIWQLSIEAGVAWVRANGASGSWGTGYNDGKWHHCLLTFPASGTMSSVICYVDGVQLTGSFASGTVALNTGTSNKIRFASSISNSNLFAGSLAEFAVWNTQLTAPEAAALATGVNVRRIRPGAIVSYFPLWGLQSPEPDVSGAGYTGTLTGTSFDNHAPVTLFSRRTRIEIEPAAPSTPFIVLKPIFYRPRFEPALYE